MRPTNTEQTLSQLEDTVLTLAVEHYAQEAGRVHTQELENALRQGEATPMPEELDAKCQKLIQKAYDRSRKKRMLSMVAKALGTAAAVVLLLGFSTDNKLSADSVPPLSMEFVVDETGSFGQFRFPKISEGTGRDFDEILRAIDANIPENYRLHELYNIPGHLFCATYFTEDNNTFDVFVKIPVHSGKFNAERIEYTKTSINGHTGYYFYGRYLMFIWLNEEEGLVYEAYSTGLSEEDFWKIIHAIEK